jgi:RNA polymerase sigma-70 factor (ECF subfamily)
MELFPGVSHEHLLGVARRIVGHEEAEDVVQTAYLKAVKAQESFRGDSKMGTWLHQITHRCAIDALRLRKRRPEEQMTGGNERKNPRAHLETPMDTRGNPIDSRGRPAKRLIYEVDPLHHAEMTQEAVRRIEGLPPLYREALQALLLWKTTEGTAAALGISVCAAKHRIRRGKLALDRRTT